MELRQDVFKLDIFEIVWTTFKVLSFTSIPQNFWFYAILSCIADSHEIGHPSKLCTFLHFHFLWACNAVFHESFNFGGCMQMFQNFVNSCCEMEDFIFNIFWVLYKPFPIFSFWFFLNGSLYCSTFPGKSGSLEACHFEKVLHSCIFLVRFRFFEVFWNYVTLNTRSIRKRRVTDSLLVSAKCHVNWTTKQLKNLHYFICNNVITQF